MTVQHGLKTLIFALFGFVFVPWLPFLAAMVAAGLLGTWLGKTALNRQSDARFGIWLNYALIAVALRLIWGGIARIALNANGSARAIRHAPKVRCSSST